MEEERARAMVAASSFGSLERIGKIFAKNKDVGTLSVCLSREKKGEGEKGREGEA